MHPFTIKLAGVSFEVDALFPSTLGFCKEYLTDEKAKYIVKIADSDLVFEREHADGEYKESYLETLAVYRKIVRIILNENALLFHGSAIELDGKGVLFIAKSGTGKTTHTLLWKKILGAKFVNGDKPLIKLEDGKPFIYGTPWQGKENLGENTKAPLSAIVVLERGKGNKITETSVSNVLNKLLEQIYIPEDSDELKKALEILSEVCKNVKIYSLACNMEDEAAIVAHKGIYG